MMEIMNMEITTRGVSASSESIVVAADDIDGNVSEHIITSGT